MDGLAGVRQTQAEQVAGDKVAARADRDLAEVDFCFPTGQVSLRHERLGRAASLPDPDFGSTRGDVVADHPVGDAGRVMLRHQPIEDPRRGVLLLRGTSRSATSMSSITALNGSSRDVRCG